RIGSFVTTGSCDVVLYEARGRCGRRQEKGRDQRRELRQDALSIGDGRVDREDAGDVRAPARGHVDSERTSHREASEENEVAPRAQPVDDALDIAAPIAVTRLEHVEPRSAVA